VNFRTLPKTSLSLQKSAHFAAAYPLAADDAEKTRQTGPRCYNEGQDRHERGDNGCGHFSTFWSLMVSWSGEGPKAIVDETIKRLWGMV
jgi:hypothetical protein